MIVFENLTSVPIRGGDDVVAAIQFRDYVLVFTRRGTVYRVREDGTFG
jgi:hypothetical protein